MADTEDQEPAELTAEEQHVRDKQLLEVLERDDQLAALKALLAQEPMRDFLWRLLAHCKVYGSVYNRNFGDFAVAEGARHVGLWLINEICEADPEAEMLMRRKALAVAHAMAKKEREDRSRRGRRGS